MGCAGVGPTGCRDRHCGLLLRLEPTVETIDETEYSKYWGAIAAGEIANSSSNQHKPGV